MSSPDITNDDWNSFEEASRTFSRSYLPLTAATTGKFQPTAAFSERFPVLAELLSQSRLTISATRKGERHLHAWTAADGRRFGWLCYPPGGASPDVALHEDHLLLLTCFGGICEYWNAPISLINNLNGALGVEDALPGFGYGAEAFADITADDPGPIQPDDYLVFAGEANGDLFVYHRETSDVLLIGFDTGRTNLTHVEGYLDLVYTVNGAPTLQHWIEMLAREFLDHGAGLG